MPPRTDLAIILTARMDSSRLPGKAAKTIRDKPLIEWIIRRLAALGQVILATTDEGSDDHLAYFARALNVSVYRGSTNDVIGRMDEALKLYAPKAEFVLRGLGDMPFIAHEVVFRACEIMKRSRSDAFVWSLPFWVWPVYGAREFPYSRTAWDKIVAKSKEREHVDMYFHTHRGQFKVAYHEPPPNYFFRTYRLEVDWQEDLDMVRSLSNHVSMLAPIKSIIETLDSHREISDINRHRVETTGPTRYSRGDQQAWLRVMKGKEIHSWTDTVWRPVSPESIPVYCNSGQCLIGYAEHGTFYRMGSGDRIRGEAYIECPCGAGKYWRQKG